MSTQQLVFGDDRSEAADLVWGWIDHQPWPGWRISVVSAQPGEEGVSEDLQPWDPESPRTLTQPAPESVVEHLRAAADPRTVLASCTDASLVVVGPRGTGVLKSMHIGSTTESLLSANGSPAPLAIIRSSEPTRHVVHLADGSPQSKRAAEVLASLPWIGDCRITLAGLVDTVSDTEAGIEHAVQTLHGTGADLEVRRSGAIRGTYTMDVKAVLLDMLAELEPDLVAIGTRGLGGIRRLLLGSTARAVVHHANCSTLVTHAADS